MTETSHSSKIPPSPPSNSPEMAEPPSQQHRKPFKPAIILISSPNTDTAAFTARYRSILTKMQRDARLLLALGLADLQRILANETKADSIAGLVVTDASIMDVDDDEGKGRDDGNDSGEKNALSQVLSGIATGEYSCSSSYEQQKTQRANTDTGRKTRLGWKSVGNSESISIRPREWTVVFAFDFPSQAALQPLRFRHYMAETFRSEIGWKICGTTKAKWMLQMSERWLRKMGERVYRGNRYEIRAVFLDGVEETDKVLVVEKGKASGISESVPELGTVPRRGQSRELYSDRLGELAASASKDETDSTAGDEEVEVARGDGSWTLATSMDGAVSHPPWGQAEHLNMLAQESLREEQEGADDELVNKFDDPYEGEDEKEDEDARAGDSDSNIEQPAQRLIYVNVPEKRRKINSSGNIMSASDADSPADEDVYRSKKQKNDACIADCPVALHEIKSWAERGGQRFRVRGYVGFVGHVEDNRSMASLILGMCGVQNARPLS
ncbi:uncharacterized protein BDV17DRAFT_291138 [Aspergillus undulatus]|uniref:uncharacterized protein n=1 Tax=Aspergillus undulatus TaxID=1810928 RepID=UPI003CCCFE0D